VSVVKLVTRERVWWY